MQELGLRPSVADPCLFLDDTDGSLLTVSVHVDDCCITYSDERKYKSFRKRLEENFQISKSDDSNTFLGMVIERPDGELGPVHVHQQPYLTDILTRYRHLDAKPASTPAEPGLKLSKEQMPKTEGEKAAMKDVPYRQLVGALLYLANCTRPDIAHAVGVCARFGSNPGRVHWQALKHVLRYLRGTREYGITFGLDRDAGIPHTCIHGYVDGNWGGDPDDRRSTTGYIYMSYGGPVCWRSKKQASTALSSCESEYMAASEAAKEAIWLTRLYKQDFGIVDVSLITKGDLTEKEYLGAKPLTVFEDNVGCISLSKNPVMHRASKHIEIRYHFVREKVQDGSLKLVYIPSSENIADVLTKSTRKNTFIYLRDKFMHSPQRTPHEALTTRRALLAELVQETANLPPMKVDLKPGAISPPLPCEKRYTSEQLQWLKTHLRELVDAGVIREALITRRALLASGALVARRALIAELVQETVRMNEWEPEPRASHRLRLMADLNDTARAEGDFLNAVETHMIDRESYVSWEGELIHCDEESDND